MSKHGEKFKRFGDIPKMPGVAIGAVSGMRQAIEAAAKAEADGMRAGLWMSRHGLTTDMLKTMTVVELARYLSQGTAYDGIEIPAEVMRTLARLKG